VGKCWEACVCSYFPESESKIVMGSAMNIDHWSCKAEGNNTRCWESRYQWTRFGVWKWREGNFSSAVRGG